MGDLATSIRVLAILALVSFAAAAEAANTFHVVSQYDWAAKQGFYINLECSAIEGDVCRLRQIKLALGVADGKSWRFIVATPEWQFDHAYTVKAVVSPKEARLSLDGTGLGVSQGVFAPLDGAMQVNSMQPWASSPTDYLVFVDSFRATSGGRTEKLSFEQESARPMGLVLFEPQSPRRVVWQLRGDQPLTIEAVFRLVKRPDINTLAPYIDRYGQCRYADWPGKIKSDDDLRKSADEESARLAKMGEVTGYDKYGGYLNPGWKENATGFYGVTKRDGFWWFVSPEGNPCFYVGLCTVSTLPWESTLITGRESLFEQLPPKTVQGWVKNAMGEKDGCDYLSFAGPNMAIKYGDSWQTKADDVIRKRMKCWGFSGVGKWAEVKGLPVVPVLNRSGVPNAAEHPDVFDPEVKSKFEDVLRKQIEPRLKDPMVVGWSLGNEIAEIVKAKEIEDILARPAASPIKRALVDHVLAGAYAGDVAKMSSAWGATAKTADDLYVAALKSPPGDVEKMRQFYASRYYEFIYRTVKRIDPNHLYFGFWIVPGWWENEADWRISAPYCDIIGYDLYTYDHTDKLLMRLAKETDKPIFCGEFSFPAYYAGRRGFGVYPVFADDEADSGDNYARWVRQAAQNPYCVGTMWFHYRDQMLTGRGPGSGLQLVLGEHYSFGTVDVADRPKWDLVERMRKANVSAARWRLDAMSR